MNLHGILNKGQGRRLVARPIAMLAVIGVAMLGGIATAVTASAHTNSHEATCSTVSVNLAKYDESTTGTPAINKWYSWTGGPSHSHSFPSEHWQLDQGNHNGLPSTVNAAFWFSNGASSAWFYHEVVSETLAKVNHVNVWINGSLVADEDFSVSYSHTFDFPDKYATTNTYRVAVTESADGIGIFDTGTLDVAACVRTASMNLTYMTDCSPDTTNTWRIHNGSTFAVPYTLEYYRQGVVDSGIAQPGDTLIDLPRVDATAILRWGGGDSGIIKDSKTKASGIDGEKCVVVPPPPNITRTIIIPVTPPVFIPGSCTAIGAVAAADTVNYRWVVTGPATAPSYAAVAKNGEVLSGITAFGPFDLSQILSQSVDAAAACYVALPAVAGVVKNAPVKAAPVKAAPVKAAPVKAAPAPAVAPAVKTLAFTGAETVPLGLSGLLALVLGAVLTVASRRQRPKQARE